MKILSVLLLIVTYPGVSSEAAKSLPKVFALYIQAERIEVASGDTVVVKALMTNQSDRAVSIRETSSIEEYRMDVRDAQRVPVHETQLGRELKDNSNRMVIVQRNFITKLKPGATYEDRVEVSPFMT